MISGCGWILGKDGFYHVDPKWTNYEKTLPKKSVLEEGNVATRVMVNEDMGMVDSGKVALRRDVEERAGVVDTNITRPASKKNFGTLGPKGLKRNGGKNYYGGLGASNYSKEDHKVGDLALVLESMKSEGYGAFPDDFCPPPSFKSKKLFTFVRSDVTCYKLAESHREESKISIFNPFAQGVPFGEPLSR